MSDDLIERLKYFSGWSVRNPIPDDTMTARHHLIWDAIDEIERLKAENGRLEAALEIAEKCAFD